MSGIFVCSFLRSPRLPRVGAKENDNETKILHCDFSAFDISEEYYVVNTLHEDITGFAGNALLLLIFLVNFEFLYSALFE